jgi:hypothetical protein
MPKRLKKPLKRVPTPPKPKRPSDPNLAARAALMAHLIRTTAHEPADKPPTFDELYRAHMAELGAKGGTIGGKRRLETMSHADRVRIAQKAARARWRR